MDLITTLLSRVNISDQDASILFTFANGNDDQFKRSGQLSDLNSAIFLYQQALLRLPSRSPSRSDFLNKLANALDTRYGHTGQLDDLDECISLHRQALALRPLHHPNRSTSLINLASAVDGRFRQTGQLVDLDEAISLNREALQLLPLYHSQRSMSLNNLANSLDARFSQTGQMADVEEAIALHRQALALRPASHPHRAMSLGNLGNALKSRYRQTGQAVDVNEAVSLHREALALRPIPHPNRSISLDNLASSLDTRFDRNGQLEDMEEAIALHREAIQLRPDPHPKRPTSLNNLATILEKRFGQTGELTDINEAISLYQEALALLPEAHPARSSTLNNLAVALDVRSNKTGESNDTSEAISLHRQALDLRPAPHPERVTSLSNLSAALETRFKQTGQVADIEEAIVLNREALTLRPVPHPNRPISLDSLASSLDARFRQTAQLEDLDEAISLYREALELKPVPHRERWTSLNNLGNSLPRRFDQTGHTVDIEEAISLHREALGLLPANHPNRSTSLNNLANALKVQLTRTGQFEQLSEVISLHREALELRPMPHPERSMSLCNLGIALSMRFVADGGKLEDIDNSISLHREGLSLRPSPHPDRPASLSGLANSLDARFRRTKQLVDINEAISLHRQALDLLPADHPERSTLLNNLADSLANKFQQLGDSADLEEAIDTSRAAVQCESAAPSRRFFAALFWASNADPHHESAVHAYQSAIELLNRLAMFSSDVRSRQEALRLRSEGLACNAAACAIRRGLFGKAVELLEEGRSIFWSGALQLRTPLDDLQLVAPELSHKLQNISRILEQTSLRDVSRNLFDTTERVISAEQEAIRYRHLNEEWLATLEEVRKLEGFEEFLRPNSSVKLQNAASRGPVVILNASKSRCDALVVSVSGIEHIALPEVTAEFVVKLVHLVQYASGAMAVPAMSKIRDLIHQTKYPPGAESQIPMGKPIRVDDIFRHVLEVLWISTVEPVIRSLGLQKSQSPSRLWWCPTGPFAFLPIHAAGIYNTDRYDALSDYVVSSYTPTLKALLASPPLANIPFKMMVVTQAEAPGHNPLPSTRDELLKIEGCVPREFLLKLGADRGGEPASVESVLAHLPSSSVVHLACHGVQDMHRPLDSALILEGGHELKISRLMALSMPSASLAFLSACETAAANENLPDESIHIAASLLFAGFRGVVATMWSMADEDGPKVANRFYSHLFRRSNASVDSNTPQTPDTTEAAQALHVAVNELRAEGCGFARWVTFIHLGL
ncbi:hypothetical protein M413DRAFT_445696 [Hebeloma cylindrosporum]|uniref:CHAT domain-containing protein n=1 Tax=Hebeloma cylindrosporum TaxID=76867 RepID=A0A0C3CBC4_HEBCY|nr:hypothetical protein M413DRAFT_445696 [Hebeloma cylindrosporum h7]